MRRQLRICGVAITDQTQAEALAQLDASLKSERCHTVVFPNAATINLACERKGFADTLNAATHVFGDGTGIRWAARMRGVTLQDNLNGTDLIPAFLKRHPGLRVFLLGGTPELIEKASVEFAEIFPEVVLAGMHHGYFDHHECPEVIEAIRQSKADLLLVGFGNPLQEEFLARHQKHLPVRLAAGVGGLFSYWAGELDRAPEAYRQSGMEWVHILMRQPHKAKRYLMGNPLFLMRMMLHLPSDAALAGQGTITERA
jgi:N-acetylglucosaminyldiphosphoundecaprenol N-acetyl-beta-D-mannosaminyltransferase